MQKKIAILINSLRSGGAEKQSALLAKALSVKYNVIFVIFDGSDINSRFLELIKNNRNIRLEILKGNKLTILYKAYQLFKKEKPDISFSYLPYSNIVNGISGWLAGVNYRIGGIRNAYLERIKFIPQMLIHNYFLQASISNSLAGKISHEQGGHDKAPVFHVPNCYPLKNGLIVRPSMPKVKIISVGRFVRQKNYDLALEAFSKCVHHLASKKSEINLEFDIIGFGDLESAIRNKIDSLGLNDSVNILLDPPNIDSYYKSTDIYLSTSIFEGLSNSIMEAMSFSLPIVATDVGGNAELVENNINGYLTDLTVDDVTGKLLIIIEDSMLRVKFGKASFDKLKNTFSEEVFFRNYDTLIESNFEI